MPGEVDLDELAARATAAAQSWVPGCAIDDIQPLTGGASSLTFTGHVVGGPPEYERIVLKVAPPGLEPVRNRDVARQARLMRALDGAPGVRVPSIFFEDDGNPPEVSPFHAMNVVAGECLEPILTPPPPDVLPVVPDRGVRRRRDAGRVAPRRPREGRARRREGDVPHRRDQAVDAGVRDGGRGR